MIVYQLELKSKFRLMCEVSFLLLLKGGKMDNNNNSISTKQKLSFFWIFLVVNYIFCDVFSLYLSETLSQLLTGEMNGVVFNEKSILGFSILLELPMLMILLSILLSFKINRIANIVVGLLMTIVQIGSLSYGGNYLHYIFFSIIELATLVSIIWIAFNWKESEA